MYPFIRRRATEVEHPFAHSHHHHQQVAKPRPLAEAEPAAVNGDSNSKV